MAYITGSKGSEYKLNTTKNINEEITPTTKVIILLLIYEQKIFINSFISLNHITNSFFCFNETFKAYL